MNNRSENILDVVGTMLLKNSHAVGSMKGSFHLGLFLFIFLSFIFTEENRVYGQKRFLDPGMHHLRWGELQEWSDFPKLPEGSDFSLQFKMQKITSNQTLQIRQQDVKQEWEVKINGHFIGHLDRDESDKIIYFHLPSKTFIQGENTLQIIPIDTLPDDIKVGQLILHDLPISKILSEAIVNVEVWEEEDNNPIPARITIVNAEGAFQTLGPSTAEHLAIRPGMVYTGTGKASFSLPSGKYTLFASRGFEYGMDSVQLTLNPGDQIHKKLLIKREVPTKDWISSDTHIHTFTHSGHGDATEQERVLSIAGEGIELPIITDHNVHVDIEPMAQRMHVRSYFTPIIGNEVTTGIGHFNIFPVEAASPIPDTQTNDWDQVSKNIAKTLQDGAIIINHARDLHAGFRPFGEDSHIAIAGENLKGWELPANSMEVVNSGAQQTDMMQLFHDWFGMMNRGHQLTPVGSSDSHDVSRYIVGQARTYIRSQSQDPGNIDRLEAVKNFREGRVMVSFGLLTEISVDGLYGPGDMVSSSDEITVSVSVLGPAWVRANQISLYANGKKIRETAITGNKGGAQGVKWMGEWVIPRQKQDYFLVAIATGPDPKAPFWPIAKPYQPGSPTWVPSIIGSSGAVWVDADGDRLGSSAYDYAKELLEESKGNMKHLFKNLEDYDEAVAIQTASLILQEGGKLEGKEFYPLINGASPAIKAGFLKIIKAWKVFESRK